MDWTAAEQIGWGLAGTSLLMLLLWLVQWYRTDASIVDVGWAGGIGLMALWLAGTSPGPLERRWWVGGLAAAWAFRLAGFLFFNRVWHMPEDGRYQELRQRWGARAHSYFLLFFQAQALLVILFSLPILTSVRHEVSFWRSWDFFGIAVWVLAFGGEGWADRQLARFRRDPENRGKVCQTGLWRYSRHPNYFCEWLHWWAYVFFAVGSSWWWVSLLGPILMGLFLWFITGIPATEAHALRSRGEAYRQYQRTTSPFIPWFPRKDPL